MLHTLTSFLKQGCSCAAAQGEVLDASPCLKTPRGVQCSAVQSQVIQSSESNLLLAAHLSLLGQFCAKTVLDLLKADVVTQTESHYCLGSRSAHSSNSSRAGSTMLINSSLSLTSWLYLPRFVFGLPGAGVLEFYSVV